MGKRKKVTVRKILVFIFVFFLLLTIGKNLHKKYVNDVLFYYRHQLEALPPEQIIPHLNLNPNETVYDIGAGYGFFTFPIAQKLQGTGKIYATELNNDRLFLVRFNKFLHRIENVHPRIVAAQGVDPLYLQDKADLILLAEVYEYLPEPIKYFKELRNALKPHGRIVIISGRTTPAMTPSAIRDFAGFIQELARLDISHPLKKSTVPLLPCKENAKELFTEQFSKTILCNTSLFPQLQKHYSPRENLLARLPLLEREKAQWLAASLDETGVFGRSWKTLSAMEQKSIYELNYMVIANLFPKYITRKKLIKDSVFLPTEKSVIADMNAAGYKLQKSYSHLPYFFFLEFIAHEL